MTGPDDEIIAALRSSPGDPPPSDVYARVATGVRRRRRRHIALSSAGVAACMVAALAVTPVLLRGHGSTPAPPSGTPSGPLQSVAAPPMCASTLDAQPIDAPGPSGSGLVPGAPSSAALCEYDQIDQPHPLKRYAQLDAGQLGKVLAIVSELKLTDEVASCPLQPTVDLMTFGYPNGDMVTLRIGCAMVWRSENAHAMLTSPLSDEVEAILGAVSSSPPPSPPPSSTAPVLVPGGGVVLELDDSQRLQVVNLETGATIPVALKGIPGGPSLIATDPAGGWVVTYTPDAAPGWGRAASQLAVVDSTGQATPFAPTYPAATSITGLAVSPDGSRVAVSRMRGVERASITVMPMPGHSGPTQTWTADDVNVNQIDDLSWAPDGTRLTYIAGSETGGGIGGDAITLDTSTSGKAPTRSIWSTQYCGGVAAAWLGTTGRLAVIRDCTSGAVFSEVDLKSGAPVASSIDLPGHGCAQPDIHPSADGSKSLVAWCGVGYLISGHAATPVGDHITDAAWGG